MVFKGLLSSARVFCKQSLEAQGRNRPFFRDEFSVVWDVSARICRNPALRRVALCCNEKLNILGEGFAKQCNALVALRVRRTAQILYLYNRLYNEKTLKFVVSTFGQQFLHNVKGRPLNFLFGACLFSWVNEKVTDSELDECASDLHYIQFDPARRRDSSLASEKWEQIIEREHLQVWRKPVPDSYRYEYKVCGRYFDIPPRAFFSIQTDLEYRKQWDRLVIKLDRVDRDEESGSEVIHWIMHYPYPMYAREYVFLRRIRIDSESKTMVLVSRATHHPEFPENKKYVRVNTYNSKMVIKAHNGFDENGFDYILTYSDDPQSAIPSGAYNWMASTGVPDFVDKLHLAAKKLHESKHGKRGRTGIADGNDVPCYS
ncbi:stAR-related lipid transfer protein 7, mitochondrial-like [Lineus longissimus]|uniref:stAR-related lipid transfer protein 7, mitochondrial-like n=1 Tax=Lineus longissimus TaxID=88925 RepID=UPI00315D649A